MIKTLLSRIRVPFFLILAATAAALPSEAMARGKALLMLDEIDDILSGEGSCDCPPCEGAGDGNLMAEECFTAAKISRTSGGAARSQDGCVDFVGYVCGPALGEDCPENPNAEQAQSFECRLQKDRAEFNTYFDQNRKIENAAEDSWLLEHAPPHHREAVAVTNPVGSVRVNLLPSTVYANGAFVAPATSVQDLTQASIDQVRATDPARADLLAAQRTKIFSIDGSVTAGADSTRCRARASWGPNRFNASSAGCQEAIRGSLIGQDVQTRTIQYSFGERPRAGTSDPSLTLARTLPDGSTANVSLTQRWGEVRTFFNGIKTDFLARIDSAAGLSASQKALMRRIVQDVQVAGSTAFTHNQYNREGWDSMCGFGSPNAAMDDEFSHSDPAGGFHRHAMLICPETILNASDEWLESVIAHEIGHAVGPGALERLQTRYLTPEFQSESGVPQAERAYYRSLADGLGPDAVWSPTAGGGVMGNVYGSPSHSFVWESGRGGGWRGVEPPSDGSTGWLQQSLGGCYEAFSTCSRREASANQTLVNLGPNLDHCDSCFQIQHGQLDEITADELSATVVGNRLVARQPRLSGGALRSYLQKSYQHFCFGGMATPTGHPPSLARLARIIGPSSEIREALGCTTARANQHATPCRAGWDGARVVPRNYCLPASARSITDLPDTGCAP